MCSEIRMLRRLCQWCALLMLLSCGVCVDHSVRWTPEGVSKYGPRSAIVVHCPLVEATPCKQRGSQLYVCMCSGMSIIGEMATTEDGETGSIIRRSGCGVPVLGCLLVRARKLSAHNNGNFWPFPYLKFTYMVWFCVL